jgi:hypothetical protein
MFDAGGSTSCEPCAPEADSSCVQPSATKAPTDFPTMHPTPAPTDSTLPVPNLADQTNSGLRCLAAIALHCGGSNGSGKPAKHSSAAKHSSCYQCIKTEATKIERTAGRGSGCNVQIMRSFCPRYTKKQQKQQTRRPTSTALSSPSTYCAAGRYFVAYPGYPRQFCVRCPEGKWSASTGRKSKRCHACTAGHYGLGGSTTALCTRGCAKGRYSQAGKAGCLPCLAGRYADKPRQAIVCKNCPRGKVRASSCRV